MPRALTIAHSKVAPPERDALLERLRARRQAYEAAGCHYWAFENPQSMGEFTEFAEARDDATLAAAHRTVADPLPGATHIFHEVDLA